MYIYNNIHKYKITFKLCWHIGTASEYCSMLYIYTILYMKIYTHAYHYAALKQRKSIRILRILLHAPYIYPIIYSQSHLGWHFRKLKAQSSNVSFATFQWKETFELWALCFETSFENVTPSGIGCTWIHICRHTFKLRWYIRRASEYCSMQSRTSAMLL